MAITPWNIIGVLSQRVRVILNKLFFVGTILMYSLTEYGHKPAWVLWLGYLLHIWAYINTGALYSVLYMILLIKQMFIDGKYTCICHINLEGEKKQEAREDCRTAFTIIAFSYWNVLWWFYVGSHYTLFTMDS